MAAKTQKMEAVAGAKPAPKSPSFKWVGWVLFVALAASMGTWGFLNHPDYIDWQRSKLTLKELEVLRVKSPNDPDLLYHLGKRLNEEKRFADAAIVLNYAAGVKPDSARLRDEWARALLNQGQVTAAFGQLKQFVGTYPDNPEGHLALGKFYFSQRAMDKAAEEMETVLAKRRNSGEAWSFLGAAQEALGNLEKARQAALEAVRLRPENATDRLLLASLQERLNQPELANESYIRAAELATVEPAPHRQYARWLLLKGTTPAEWLKAEQAAKRATELDKTDATAYLLWGRALVRQGKDSEAITPLTRSAELGTAENAASELAASLRKRGKTDEAQKWEKVHTERLAYSREYKRLSEAIRIRPKDRALHREMSLLVAKQGEVGEVQRHVAAELNRAVDSVQVLTETARRLNEAGQAKKALPLAFEAIQMGRYSPVAHEILADIYLALDMPHQAGMEYNEAADLLPSRKKDIEQKIAKYVAMREKNPTPAEVAYRTSLRETQSLIGPQTVSEDVEKLAQKATELDPYNPKYWWHLMNLQMDLKKTNEAIESGKKLLTIAPTYRKGNALMAVLLTETAATEAEFKEVESYIQNAAQDEEDKNRQGGIDPTVEALRYYAQGLLLLKRGMGKEAAVALREAAVRDPMEPVTYYKLSQAERLAGNTQAADNALNLFNALQADRTAQANALSDIAQNPNDPTLYEKAAKLFEEHELPEQAEAIRAEARRRFGRGGTGEAGKSTPKQGIKQ